MSNQTVSERKVIGVKDIILGMLLSLVVLVVGMVVMPFIQPLGMQGSTIAAVIIPAIIGGTIYVLIINKSPRIGACFVFTVPFAVMFLITGTIAAPILFLLGGIVSELIMLGGGYSKKWRGAIAYSIFWLSYSFGSLSSMLFMPDSSIQMFIGMGMDEASAQAMLETTVAIYTEPVFVTMQIVGAIISSVVGYFIGVKLLHKRFKGAGVA